MSISIQIGSAAVAGNAFLAPMSGITDPMFRRIATRFGASLVVTEMVASREYISGSTEARLRSESAGVGLHVVQIAGCEPSVMGEAARLAEASGAEVIDINMGCPARKVTGGWAGSALMRDKPSAMAIVSAVRGAVDVPVTLKMRLGWDASSHCAPDFAQEACARGVAMVTVHGRTRCDFYNGTANWQAIKSTRERVALPLVVNGDIVNVATASSSLAASGADAVMIGRGAMGRPWLVGQIAAVLAGRTPCTVDGDHRSGAAIEHFDWLLGAMGRTRGLRHARKHLAAYLDAAAEDGFAPAPGARAEVVLTEDCDRVVTLLQAAFAQRSDSPAPRP